eukprot:gnl/MRDRNA2_/MRDRNA2_80479_c0_seq2.p2 gnl/MRDRNA2_/MRDRNA2_80479_c0~~gnl/MRDRNA2_/MRDRNA2_80479_c0_seq2.p2  ORF type:complete len:148 (+),score=22.91 gnl/MRDRNA2_/MRDRNA2_80479_c0_seq2:641-1084(+)
MKMHFAKTITDKELVAKQYSDIEKGTVFQDILAATGWSSWYTTYISISKGNLCHSKFKQLFAGVSDCKNAIPLLTSPEDGIQKIYEYGEFPKGFPKDPSCMQIHWGWNETSRTRNELIFCFEEDKTCHEVIDKTQKHRMMQEFPHKQ